MKNLLIAPILFLAFLSPALAQLRLPQASPKAQVSQTIGLTDVTVAYHTPGVKGREVWGKMVPYGQVWRSGANEATLITFSDSVKVNGKSLQAGTYSLFTFPETKNKWFVIFHKDTSLWGTDGYNPEKDALRVPVTPDTSATLVESLQYSFSNIKTTSATLHLAWEKLIIPVTIEVEVFEKALSNMQEDLSQAKTDDWAIFAQAAHYLIQNNTHHELALTWINKSLRIKENFYNSWLKAQLLAQKDEYQEAVNLAKKAMKLGQNDVKNYSLLSQEMERSLNEWKVKMHYEN
jgi:tetratricopeptide (TPR) repeat protein